LVDPRRLEELFEQIEPDLFRYPSLDAADLRAKLARTLGR
jgi:histidinol-phosphate/aromatic aminotransferase/cobyric acid decarboxylase-like protein